MQPNSQTIMNEAFLLKAFNAATQAAHIWPAYAASEAALESTWGRSELAVKANNLFGQKQSHPPLTGTTTLTLPTQEFLDGQWKTIPANWCVFPTWEACFAARMALLHRLSAYAPALAAATGPEFVIEVSRVWSTDPGRAQKVLSVHDAHLTVFGESK